jgi:hypothetical protein
VIAFFDVLIIREERTLATKVYRKQTHTGRYLNLTPSRNDKICLKKNRSLRSDLQLNGYPQCFIDLVINPNGSSRLNKEQKPLGFVYIPYVKGVSEKFKGIGNRYIRTIFKTRHTLSSLMKTRPKRDSLQMAQCIYSIPRV